MIVIFSILIVLFCLIYYWFGILSNKKISYKGSKLSYSDGEEKFYFLSDDGSYSIVSIKDYITLSKGDYFFTHWKTIFNPKKESKKIMRDYDFRESFFSRVVYLVAEDRSYAKITDFESFIFRDVLKGEVRLNWKK